MLDEQTRIVGTAEEGRLTAKTEEVELKLNRVVSDGTNRIGDIEFRLCEATDGCDPATLPETPVLGGGSTAPEPVAPVVGGTTVPADPATLGGGTAVPRRFPVCHGSGMHRPHAPLVGRRAVRPS